MNEPFPVSIKREHGSLCAVGEKVLLACFFIVMGTLIYVVFSPYRPILGKTADYIGRMALTLLLFVGFLLVRKSQVLVRYSPLLLGFLIMSAAVTLDYIGGTYVIEHLGLEVHSPHEFALLKLNEFAIITAVVCLLTILFGGSLGSIYLQKGRLRLGLVIGILTFLLAAAGSIPMAQLMFKGNGLTVTTILPWIPWLLISIFASAFEEELVFRGLFLRKLQPFFGSHLSNLLIVVVFTLIHAGVTYTSSEMAFLVVLLPLSWLWGYLMQKTDSIWASLLFHAGMDIPIFLGIFAGMA